MHVRRLLSAALAFALSACSAQLYDKEKDDQATALKTGLSSVSFDSVFATARANENAVSDATTDAYQRLAAADAKLKLFVVLSAPRKLTDRLGLQGKLAARWAALMCDDPTACAPPSQFADEWYQKFCKNPSPFDQACQIPVPPPVRFSQIIKLGLSDYNAASLATRRLRLADSADQVVIASGRPAPECTAKPLEKQELVKPARELAAPEAALPSTEEFTHALPADVASHTTPIYQDYVTICAQTLGAQYELTWLVGTSANSDIGRGWKAWKSAADDLATLQIAARERAAMYDADNVAYKKALADIKNSALDAEAMAKDLLAKASVALDAVDELNDFGKVFAAQERLKSLEEIISALGGNSTSTGNDKNTLTPDVRANLAAISKLPHLIDDSAALFNAAKQARLAPLVLELSYQEQVLIATKRRIDAMEAAVERGRQVYLAAVAEAGKIAYAQERVLDASTINGFADQPLYVLLKGANQSANKEQTALLDALDAYYESQVKYNSEQQKVAFDESAAAFQRNLDDDQIALNEWLALSKGNSEILSAYFASGVKPQELANLLVQLIGLGSIGVGVNR